MILSPEMRPPFKINTLALNLIFKIGQILGALEGQHLSKPTPKLRKSNRVRTVQGSLAIEGNTLALDQVTAIFDGKRVLGPKAEILEVQNAILAYEQLHEWRPHSAPSMKQAHRVMMKNLIAKAGDWRTGNVGIFQGDLVRHAAPQAKWVPKLMSELFSFLKTEKQVHPIVLSAIFHYELEFIHPFTDGNGRMGRLWQTLLLTHHHPLFEFTPLESVIHAQQRAYYDALGAADKMGEATPFIEFSLATIVAALEDLSENLRPQPLNAAARLEIAQSHFQKKSFSRKDYLLLFKTISSATASRDLSQGVAMKLLKMQGDRATTIYRFNT